MIKETLRVREAIVAKALIDHGLRRSCLLGKGLYQVRRELEGIRSGFLSLFVIHSFSLLLAGVRSLRGIYLCIALDGIRAGFWGV